MKLLTVHDGGASCGLEKGAGRRSAEFADVVEHALTRRPNRLADPGPQATFLTAANDDGGSSP